MEFSVFTAPGKTPASSFEAGSWITSAGIPVEEDRFKASRMFSKFSGV
jgi:hypothetical protein